jgi:hypothetical protein
MAVLTLHKDDSAVPCKTIKDVFADIFGDKNRPQTTISSIVLLSKDRRNKVMMLRRQLAHGTYDIDERLDASLERILMDLKP